MHLPFTSSNNSFPDVHLQFLHAILLMHVLIHHGVTQLSDDVATLHFCSENVGLAGGQGEADRAHAEALNACFDLEVEVHQHVQPYTSHKDGKLKWALLEMWPVPVSFVPALAPVLASVLPCIRITAPAAYPSTVRSSSWCETCSNCGCGTMR